MFLTKELGIPREFLSDIADIDERPRAEREDDWLLTILRIPMDGGGPGMPYQTVPLGIITGHRATVSVCYRRTQLLPDFINHIRRKEYRYCQPDRVRHTYDLLVSGMVPEVPEADVS